MFVKIFTEFLFLILSKLIKISTVHIRVYFKQPTITYYRNTSENSEETRCFVYKDGQMTKYTTPLPYDLNNYHSVFNDFTLLMAQGEK